MTIVPVAVGSYLKRISLGSHACNSQISRPQQGIKTRLLRTADCLRIRAQLTAFENHFFGPDFAWSLESMERWLRSGSLFYVAVCQKAPREDLRIAALASVLLTGSRSCERLLRGEILESQLGSLVLGLARFASYSLLLLCHQRHSRAPSFAL